MVRYPSIVHDMPASEYHAVQALSNSALGALARSPRHFWAEYINPKRPARKSTAAMAAGTLAHCVILEPGAFPDRYSVRPPGLDLRTKAGKEWRDATPDGVEVIDEDQAATAWAQRQAVVDVPELAALLGNGAAEVSAFWQDPATSAPCKLRADWVHPLPDGRVILMDLKTTPDASPDGFARSVAKYGYHRQAAWYSHGWTAATGQDVAAFVFAAVTGDYPFIAVPYMLDDAAKAAGHQQCIELLATYERCIASGTWPAYGSGVQVLTLPAWAAH